MPDDKKPRASEQKWTKDILDAGYTLVPNIFFERMKALGIDPLDFTILVHLMSYWWDVNNRPHPSKVTLANAIGVDPRTIQRRIASMEKSGYIRREQRRTSPKGSATNVYHFDGLIENAKPFARERVKERDIARAKNNQRFNRKKPVKLTVV